MGDFLLTKKERMKLPAQHPACTRGPLPAQLSPCFSSRLLQPTLCPSLSGAEQQCPAPRAAGAGRSRGEQTLTSERPARLAPCLAQTFVSCTAIVWLAAWKDYSQRDTLSLSVDLFFCLLPLLWEKLLHSEITGFSFSL